MMQAEKTTGLDWYDAVWLRAYFDAQAVIERHAPAKLAEFVDAMRVFRTDPKFEARHLTGLFDAERLAEIRREVAAIPRDRLEMHEMRQFGRFVVHNWPPFSRLQETMTAEVSELAGEALEPNYNFLSLYTHRGVCAPHLDAPSAKWTLDICLDQSEPWPIHFSPILPWPERGEITAVPGAGEGGPPFEDVLLEPGDAVLFSGSSQWHYRDALPATGSKSFCDLLFFHYIPAGTRELLKPSGWAGLFGVPELNQVAGIRDGNY